MVQLSQYEFTHKKKKAKRQQKHWPRNSTLSQSVFINCHTVLNIVREIIPQNSTGICVEPTMCCVSTEGTWTNDNVFDIVRL